MTNTLVDALNKTVSTMEALPYLKLEEMNPMDQLYFIGAYMKFSSDLEPLVKKYAGSNEKLSKLKEERAKENANKFANILSLFQESKETSDADTDTPSGNS